jgi:hypothetical protein
MGSLIISCQFCSANISGWGVVERERDESWTETWMLACRQLAPVCQCNNWRGRTPPRQPTERASERAMIYLHRVFFSNRTPAGFFGGGIHCGAEIKEENKKG